MMLKNMEGKFKVRSIGGHELNATPMNHIIRRL